jgi:hypothetical protein
VDFRLDFSHRRDHRTDDVPQCLAKSAHITAERLKVTSGEQEDRQDACRKEGESSPERAKDASGKGRHGTPQRAPRKLDLRAATKLQQPHDGN